jgi:hypothetical protein
MGYGLLMIDCCVQTIKAGIPNQEDLRMTKIPRSIPNKSVANRSVGPPATVYTNYLFSLNKPNSSWRTKNSTSCTTNSYGNNSAFRPQENKPNQTQFQTPHLFSRYTRCLSRTRPNPAPQSPRLPTSDPLILNPYYLQLPNYAKQSQFFLVNHGRNLLPNMELFKMRPP